MDLQSKILVLGANGMVGRAIVRALKTRGAKNLLTPSRAELDLTDHNAVIRYFEQAQPAYVFMAAAKVGGILANDTQPVDFLYLNTVMAFNVIGAAHHTGVNKLLFLGSTCIYPRLAPQPISETALLTGPLEPTNEAYAIAKIAGIKLCDAYRKQYGKDFISAMPTNLYGPFDNFDPESAHVLPALLRKFHEAQQTGAEAVTIWGSGKPLREFMHVDDCASACIHLMNHYSTSGVVNVGVGKDIAIQELAALVAKIIGYRGQIKNDATKPDGTPRKLVNVGKLESLGWRPNISLKQGIESTYRWYVDNILPQ